MFRGNTIYKSDILPPTTVSKATRDSKDWKIAMLDSLEFIAKEQFVENIKFQDLYRMVEGKISFQEMRDVLPQMSHLQDLLDGVGLPSFLQHHDLLGSIIREILGKFRSLQDKFHAVELGEEAKNDFLRRKDEEVSQLFDLQLEKEVAYILAKNGMTMEGKIFESEEEQQAYVQQLEQARQKAVPEELEKAKTASFKNIGITWVEETMDQDEKYFDLDQKDAENMKDKLITGRCFRHYKIRNNSYEIKNWSPKNTFFSKETDAKFTQDGEFAGQLNFDTPANLIKRHGHEIPAKKQKELLGGNPNWKNFVGSEYNSVSMSDAINPSKTKTIEAPFPDFFEYNDYLMLQDTLGIPLGEEVRINKDGSQTIHDRYLPEYRNTNSLNFSRYARLLRDDFTHRKDLCSEMEVYCKVYEKWGILCYEDEETGATIVEEVTEDILPELLKERNIKQVYTESQVEIIGTEPEVGTLKWVYRPVTYEGLKIDSSNLKEPLYLYFRPCANQIPGEHLFDTKLPVAGYVGTAVAPRILPAQLGYNVCMNQIQNLLEKEVGIFFLFDVSLIPSDVEGWSQTQDAIMEIRNMAKDIGMMPVKTSGDFEKNQNHFNQFATHQLTYSTQIINRLQVADRYKMMAYESIGVVPNSGQPVQYTTAEGVKVSQEASTAQLAEPFEEFSFYKKRAWELHLAVAQHCQANKKDQTLYYTKSDKSFKFLQIADDPKFPIRNYGLLPSEDNKKRKELEILKNQILSNNTLSSNTEELARLIATDTMSQAIQIAKEAALDKMKQDELAHNRQKELIQEQAQATEQAANRLQSEKITLKELDNQGKVAVANITALGRASDKKSDTAGLTQINTSSKYQSDQLKANTAVELGKLNAEQQDKSRMSNEELKKRELDLKEMKIEADIEMKKMDKEIAVVNKN